MRALIFVAKKREIIFWVKKTYISVEKRMGSSPEVV